MAGDADDPMQAKRCYEKLAEISGRPILNNVVVAFDQNPEVHRNTLKWLRAGQDRGPHIYGQAVTTDAGLTFEDWFLFDDADAWESSEEAHYKLSSGTGRGATSVAPRGRQASDEGTHGSTGVVYAI